jgi:SAM-dependent methyltransferase
MPPLPPRSMRFMGEDDEKFSAIGDLYVRAISEYAIPTNLLDIGCGYGRLAYALHRSGFKGPYLGLDVIPHCISWLQENFTVPRYGFRTVDVRNDRYNPTGKMDASNVRFDAKPADVVTLLSVFTHMWDVEIVGYLRALRPLARGIVYATFFIKGGEPRGPAQAIHKLSDHSYTADLNDPLHVIAYDEDWLRSVVTEAGFSVRDLKYGYQDVLVLT